METRRKKVEDRRRKAEYAKVIQSGLKLDERRWKEIKRDKQAEREGPCKGNSHRLKDGVTTEGETRMETLQKKRGR